MIKLVAFDWNGTMISDANVTAKASSLTFQKFGYKPITFKRFQETFTIPIKDFWIANGGKLKDLGPRKVTQNQTFHSFYDPMESKVRTRSGVKALLVWLAKKNIESIIFSNHTHSGITAQVDRLKIKDFIKIILARTVADGDSHIHARNKEEKLVAYVKSKKLKPIEVMVVGDTEEEIEIGKRHGYYTVSITGGFITTARLKVDNPDFLLHNLVQLEEIIRKINSI